MDCAAEEQLVRMTLAPVEQVESLSFDLQHRTLEVIHAGGHEAIHRQLDQLDLGTSFVSSVSVEGVRTGERAVQETGVLWKVLLINLALFFVEIIAGWLAGSMGLVADSLDMLADSFVYGLALYASGRTARHKKRVAKTSGYLQLSLAVLGFLEVVRRVAGLEEMPSFETMIIVSIVALTGNAFTLYLLQKSRSQEAHMQASRIFTSNDVIANLGVIVAGIMVMLTNARMPDLVIGVIIFAIVTRGAFRILRLSK